MSSLDETLQANLRLVYERISKAARTADRNPEDITLVAISKSFGADAIAAAVRAGQRSFGESYAQEAIGKIAQLAGVATAGALEWHFIGPIQSNKTRAIAEHFDWVQSVDRMKIAERLSAQRPDARRALNVLLQVNVSGEASKAGITPEEASSLAPGIAALPRLTLRGLMAIPAPTADVARQRGAFAALRALFDALRRQGLDLDTLSMGMSDDLESAIAEGATMVRVGTAIFGRRQ